MNHIKRINKYSKLGVIAVVFAVVFASCVPQKKMLYLKEAQMLAQNQSINYVNERSVDYKLQPGDNLYIRFVNIVDQGGTSSLNGEFSRTTSSDASIYLQSYTIDEEGFIELPLIGKMEVRNLTVDEAKALL